MKERKFFELSFSKKIMVILVGLLFTVIFNNHHAVYAGQLYTNIPLDDYDFEAKCQVGKSYTIEKTLDDATLMLRVNKKTRVNINVTANIIQRDLHHILDGNIKVQVYRALDTESVYYAEDRLYEKESEFNNNTTINNGNVVLEPGIYIVYIDNSICTTYYGIKYQIGFSDGSMYIQDFQLPDTITMYYEKDAKINPSSVTPSNYDVSGIKYSSSNSNVVSFYDEYVNEMHANGSGKAIVTATAKNGTKRYCAVIVKNGTPKISNKKMTIYQGYTDQVYVKNTDSKVTWKSSNKKVATVSKGGYIKGKKIGKATITGKVDGKTVKCKVTVKREPINFRVDLYGYDTRSNTFNLTIKNRTKHKLRIYSSGAYSLDKDYKSYDRKLRLTKNRKYIDIKAKKSKDIYFKVKGSTTWWDVKDAEVYFYVKFAGKKFKVCGDYEDGGYYYSGGKWKETSKNEDDY